MPDCLYKILVIFFFKSSWTYHHLNHDSCICARILSVKWNNRPYNGKKHRYLQSDSVPKRHMHLTKYQMYSVVT